MTTAYRRRHGPKRTLTLWRRILAFALSKLRRFATALCAVWESETRLRDAYVLVAKPCRWLGFCRSESLSAMLAVTSWRSARLRSAKCIDDLPAVRSWVSRATRCADCVSNYRASRVSTDPPYYDNIGYADLSDFFYVWLRRSLVQHVIRSLFATLSDAKDARTHRDRHTAMVAAERAAQAFFEHGLGKAFARMRQVHDPDFPLTVYYAFKQAETDDDDDDDARRRWHLLRRQDGRRCLQGLIRCRIQHSRDLANAHRSWDDRNERHRQNALASSIVLVCRPRPADASLATRKEFMNALRRELPDALRNLQHGNIAPVDLAQAAIGPGMAVFTRYCEGHRKRRQRR